MSTHIVKAVDKIASGARSILIGCLDLIVAPSKTMHDIRFWASGRSWDIPLGPVFGEAGNITTITVFPQCYYRGQKLMATDTAEVPPGGLRGIGTRITQMMVGQRLQRPGCGGGTMTFFYSAGALGNGINLEECLPHLGIATTVSFIQSCTFDGLLLGRALL